MRPSQKRPTDYASTDNVDNTTDPKGKQSLKPSRSRKTAGEDDDGKAVGGAHPADRLAKGDARITQINKGGGEGSSDF